MEEQIFKICTSLHKFHIESLRETRVPDVALQVGIQVLTNRNFLISEVLFFFTHFFHSLSVFDASHFLHYLTRVKKVKFTDLMILFLLICELLVYSVAVRSSYS